MIKYAMRQTKPVSITLPPALIAALARASVKTGLTRSHLVRQAITHFLKTSTTSKDSGHGRRR